MDSPFFAPVSYVQIFAMCVDDSQPEKFTPDNWIKNGRLYKVKFFSDALNTDTTAVTIMDKDNQVIKPNESYSAFRIDRFVFLDVVLN